MYSLMHTQMQSHLRSSLHCLRKLQEITWEQNARPEFLEQRSQLRSRQQGLHTRPRTRTRSRTVVDSFATSCSLAVQPRLACKKGFCRNVEIKYEAKYGVEKKKV